MSMQQYCLRWNNHQPNFISVFSSLLNNESLVDVTLSAEGRHLQAHKLVLSACSSYFQSLFTINPCQHPIVILKDVKFTDLKVMIDFMYYGEVNVSQEQLPHILKTAELLKIKGLAEIPVDQSLSKQGGNIQERAELLTPGESSWSTSQEGQQQQRQSISPGIVGSCPLSPGSRRKRLRKSSSGSTERPLTPPSDTHPNMAATTPLLPPTIKPDPGGGGGGYPGNNPINDNNDSPPHHLLQQQQQQPHPALHHPHHPSPGNPSTPPTITSATATTTTTPSNNMVDGNNSPNLHQPQSQHIHLSSMSHLTQQQHHLTALPLLHHSVGNVSVQQLGLKQYVVGGGGGGGGEELGHHHVVQQQQQQVVHHSRPGSHDSSVDSQSPHQITLQIPSQELNTTSQHSIDTPSIEIPGPSSTSSQTDRVIITTTTPLVITTPSHTPPATVPLPPVMGTKRGRFLMRQSRVKRGDTDVVAIAQHQSGSDYHHLTVPHRMVERQVSDPLPAGQTVTVSPPPTTQLLSVPGSGGGGAAILVKQHSHPLLPSQQSQYQLGSPPITTSSHGSLQHSTSVDVDLTGPVIYIDALTTSSAHETTALAGATASSSSSGTSTSGPTTATLRVRTDELKRSASSPSQSSGRSSHCPVVRSGPALGCNYCWNTVDTHGRILRRKTKYHCPECQTNLCIVPCFQEYHERQNATGGGNQTDPIALTTSVMRAFPKTSSM